MKKFKKGNEFCKVEAVNLEIIILCNIVTCESQLSEIGSIESQTQNLSNLIFTILNPMVISLEES